MALAPGWLDRELTTDEQRWVSACMFARTNYFGKHIEISMRGNHPTAPSLKITPKEEQSFTLYEGGFFGNIFLEHPVAYTCTGQRTEAEKKDPILQWRVCTQPEKLPFSKCHFIITGSCDNPKSTIVEKTTYKEIVHVFLKPGLSSLCENSGCEGYN